MEFHLNATEFDVNAPILFLIVGIIILFVMAQSIFFLVRAIRQAKRLNMDKKVIQKTIRSAAIFSIAPAVAIFIGVITLSGKFGIPLPWLRLSVIGSLTYETTAAEAALNALNLVGEAISSQAFITIAYVMTLGIIVGLIGVPLLCKPITKGMLKIKNKDKNWGEIMLFSLFIGMISAFLGLIFCDVSTGLAGWIPVFVMLISAAVMCLLAVIMKLTKIKALEDYALPISMIVSMACAIPITNLIG